MKGVYIEMTFETFKLLEEMEKAYYSAGGAYVGNADFFINEAIKEYIRNHKVGEVKQ